MGAQFSQQNALSVGHKKTLNIFNIADRSHRIGKLVAKHNDETVDNNSKMGDA
jgi:hypothetical protein